MKKETIIIEPFTRIEGHLRVEIGLKKAQVSSARLSGMMWRGLELILKGKTPKEATTIVQRICGVCPVAHAIASSRAVESAYGWAIPPLAQKVRNILTAVSTIHDHLVHFYFYESPRLDKSQRDKES